MSLSVRMGLASRALPGDAVVSVRTIADRIHLPFPTSVRDLVAVLEPIKLSFPLSAPGVTGSCEVTLTSDGLVHYSGHVHANGALAASYAAITSFPTLTDRTTYSDSVAALVGALGPVVIGHKGHVGGTLSFDTRDSDWDESTRDERLADNWAAVREAAASARTDFGTDNNAIDIVDGFVNLATGVFVFSLG